jgi:hypothetical protein
LAPSVAAFSIAARACAMLRALSAVTESWHSAALNCGHRRTLTIIRSLDLYLAQKNRNRSRDGVTLESGGVGSSSAGGERAASGRKEAAAMATRPRPRRGTRRRTRVLELLRRGTRAAVAMAMDEAAALISWTLTCTVVCS